jgi:putative hydrolase of the HAD superfamily
MKRTAAVFDLFGTLIPNFSWAEHTAVLAEMAHLVGAPPREFQSRWLESFPLRATGVFPTVDANIEYVCESLGVTPPPDAVLCAAKVRYEFTRVNFRPRAAAVTSLKALKAAGIRLGLITDCSAEVPQLWPETPFHPLFDAAVFSHVARLKKPDPRIYMLVCEHLHVVPAECVYVGDGGSHELSGAAKVGMYPVRLWVPDENSGDTHRIDGEEWSGPQVTDLPEVLAFFAPQATA